MYVSSGSMPGCMAGVVGKELVFMALFKIQDFYGDY